MFNNEIKKVIPSVIKEENIDFPLLTVNKEKYLRVLIVGRAKTGKTRFCLSAEEPILFLDTEFGAQLLADEFKDKKVYYKSVTIINEEGQIDTIKSLDFLEYCLKQSRKLGVKTIIIDSATSIWQRMQDWLRYEIVEKKGETYKSGTSTLNKFTEVPTDRRDWGKANQRYNSLIMNMLSFNCNVLLTAQNHPTYDQQGNQLPIDKPTVQKNTPFLMDVVLEMKRETAGIGNVRFESVIVDSRYKGKEMIGKKILDPTFNKVYENIYGKKVI